MKLHRILMPQNSKNNRSQPLQNRHLKFSMEPPAPRAAAPRVPKNMRLVMTKSQLKNITQGAPSSNFDSLNSSTKATSAQRTTQ